MYEITINTAFRHYNDHCRSCGRKESSLKLNAYAQGHLSEYLREKLYSDDVPLAAIDRFLLRNFLLWLRESKQVSASTVQRIYDVMNALCGFLVDEELVKTNPMAKVEKPKRDLHPIKALSIEQVQAMIDSCDGTTFTGVRNKLILALLLDTGLRATELSMLDLDDVDLAERKIVVRHTKTGVPRFTYFSSVVSRLISRYLILRGQRPCGRLIITETNQPIDRHWLRQMIGRVGDRVGIKVHPHLLRHSCAVAAIKNGSDIASVMRILGHANPRMSLHYSQLADTDVQEIHRRTSPADRLDVSKKRRRRESGSAGLG